MQATGQLYDADQFRSMVVAEYNNGARCSSAISDACYDDIQNNKTASWYNGERAIILAVQRQPGTNTVEVARCGEGGARRDRAVAAADGAS